MPYNVCPWPVDTACFDDEWESDFDEPLKTRAIALASSTLQRLTAYRVSNCTTILRPCSRACGWQSYRAEYRHWSGVYEGVGPYQWAGSWYTACGCMNNSCGHTATNTVWLPKPMGGVEAVMLDGVALTEGTDYRIQDNALIALGSTVWPLTQDLTLPDTEDNTFSVEFYNAVRPDDYAAYACALLAMQFARACAGGKSKCSLPPTVVSVVRQGVTFNLPTGSFPNGETGIREVDGFIALYNPKHRLQTPQVYVP
jgi:hypothetical protein